MEMAFTHYTQALPDHLHLDLEYLQRLLGGVEREQQGIMQQECLTIAHAKSRTDKCGILSVTTGDTYTLLIVTSHP